MLTNKMPPLYSFVLFFNCDLVAFCFFSVSGLSSLGKWFDWLQSAEHFQRKVCGICSKKEVDCDDVVSFNPCPFSWSEEDGS